jgi:hypothetical protein
VRRTGAPEATVALGSAIAVAAAVIVASTPHGPGISPDSALYLSVAEKLGSGHGLTGYGNEVLVAFPPGYPLLLAVLDLLPGVSPLSAARVGDAVLLGLIVLASWGLLRAMVLSEPLRVAGLLLVATATTVVRSASFAWSEPLFILVSLGAIWALWRAVERPASWGWLVAAVVAAEAAFFVRYVGLVLVPLGAVAFLVGGRRWRAVGFAAAAGAGPATWMARNAALSPGPFGPRDPVTTSFGDTLPDVARALGRLVAPFELASPLRAIALALACVLGGWALVAARRGRGPAAPVLTWLLLGFAALHLLVLVGASASTEIEWTDDRLLAPVLVPALLGGLGLVDAAVRERPDWRRSGHAAIAACAAVLLLAAGFAWSSLKWLQEVSDGVGYAAPRWRNSQLARLVAAGHLGGTIFSNSPDAIFQLTGVDARCWPRNLAPGGCSGTPTSERDAVDRLKARPARVVWFFGGGSRSGPRAPAGVAVRPVRRARDGAVYRVSWARR